jgi:hypothetical protein
MVEFAGAPSFAADINFFDAAGTSICAMRVVMAIAQPGAWAFRSTRSSPRRPLPILPGQ